MEFWGVEVKSGEPLTVNPGEDRMLHLSQANVGEVKKEKSNESICIYVEIDGKKLVLGTLNHEKLPQQVFDLVFDKEFQLSHSSKNGSVYFYGYTAPTPNESDDDESDSEDDIPLHIENNGINAGKQEKQAKEVKPPAAEKTNTKQAVKIAEPKKDVKPETEDSDDDSESDDDESDSDVSMADSDEDDESDDDDESSDEEVNEKPKTVENNNKKRPNESATKTPEPAKRVKQTAPKISGAPHVDTPHPAKQAAAKTPKSDGSHTCKPCKKSFKSEGALDSHTKAKHSAGK